MESFRQNDPLGYTLVKEQKEVPLGAVIEFWDVPELITTLLGIIRYT